MNSVYSGSAEKTILTGCALTGFHGADAPGLGALVAAMEPWSTIGYSGEALSSYLAKDDPALYKQGVWVKDELAGVVCVRYPWLRGPYLELLAILPRFQRLGVGGEIVEWFSAYAAQRGRNAWIMVSAFNEGARRFYERHGYSPAARFPGLLNDEFHEILLRKKLR